MPFRKTFADEMNKASWISSSLNLSEVAACFRGEAVQIVRDILTIIRMFTGSLTEEVKLLQEDIDAVRDKIDDPIICEKMRLFIYAPNEIQQVYRHDAGLSFLLVHYFLLRGITAAERMNVITCILRSGEQPALSREQLHRVFRAHRAHAEYVKHRQSLPDSDDDEGPQHEDAWLYEDLKVLAKLYARLRDREQVINLFFEVSILNLRMMCLLCHPSFLREAPRRS
jgi:hypothetical protein